MCACVCVPGRSLLSTGSGSAQSPWRPNWRDRSKHLRRSRQVRQRPRPHQDHSLLLFVWMVVMVTVFRGAGGSQEGNPPPAGSLSGLTSSVPSLNAAPGSGPAGLPEGPGHLPAGAGTRPPTGRGPGTVQQVGLQELLTGSSLLVDLGADERPGHHLGSAGSPWRCSVVDPAGCGPGPVCGTSRPARPPGEPGWGPAAHR